MSKIDKILKLIGEIAKIVVEDPEGFLSEIGKAPPTLQHCAPCRSGCRCAPIQHDPPTVKIRKTPQDGIVEANLRGQKVKVFTVKPPQGPMLVSDIVEAYLEGRVGKVFTAKSLFKDMPPDFQKKIGTWKRIGGCLRVLSKAGKISPVGNKETGPLWRWEGR